MANEVVNKVVVNGVTKIDLTSDTITASDLRSGVTAHDKSGATLTGALVVPSVESSKTYSALDNGSFTISPDTNYDAMEEVNLTVEVHEAKPIDISTDAGMTAVLTSSNLGRCYRFTGTTGTYTNGDLYIPTKSHSSIYHIYESDGVTEIDEENWNVAGLANAYYYTKGVNDTTLKRIGGRIFHIDATAAEGGSADKFYVYDTTNGLQSSLTWGGYGTSYGVTANTIGSGKTNSATVLAAVGDTSGTIWYYIKHTMNANSVGGCSDWYIGSALEMDQLRNSGLQSSWFTSSYIWSSVEYLYKPVTYSVYWYYYRGYWGCDNFKYTSYCCVAIRSF